MKRAIMRASIEIDWYTIQQNYGERVTNHSINAQVAKLVDALGSGPSGGNTVEVRFLSWAPSKQHPILQKPFSVLFQGLFLCPRFFFFNLPHGSTTSLDRPPGRSARTRQRPPAGHCTRDGRSIHQRATLMAYRPIVSTAGVGRREPPIPGCLRRRSPRWSSFSLTRRKLP